MTTEAGRCLSLDQAAKEWDREAIVPRVEQATSEREQFIEQFPLSVWPDLPLDRYALGLPNSQESLCYLLEFASVITGSIKGGSASKHLIFMRQDGTGWAFPKKYASVEEAWDAIRRGFAEVVKLLAEQRWNEADEVEATWEASAVRTKLAWMYFPDQLLPIYSFRHLDYFIDIFGLDSNVDGTINKNRLLFEDLTSRDIFKGWSPLEIMYFLYSWTDPTPSHQIVKIAPGSDAHLWDDCKSNGYVRVGWDAVGDLTLFDDVDAIRRALQSREGMEHRGTITKTARALDKLRSLQDGDIVIANRGTSAVVGLGRVAGGYEFRRDLPDHQHTVMVDWFDAEERAVDFGAAWRPTIVNVRPGEYHQILQAGDEPTNPGNLPLPPVDPVLLEVERLLERSGQVILYGPPGTGKTYTASRFATWLLSGGSADPEAARVFESTEMLRSHRDALSTSTASDERPAWLVVANPQEWAWKQLVEEGVVDYRYGRIKANYDDLEPGDAVYAYEATPVKAVVGKARIQHGLHTNAEGDKKILIDRGELIDGGPTWAQLQADPVLAQCEAVRHSMQGTVFRLEPNEAAHLDSLLGKGNVNTKPSGMAQLVQVTFHPSYTYEDFIEGYKPVESGGAGLELRMRDGVFKRLCRAAAADPDRKYVLLIDEINRGNVPKIFGELITLIEADKRGTIVTLPQSGESFAVPPNVHIIGTMNTADRSIHILDTALRRRFAFLELLPEPAHLEGVAVGNLPVDELLRELNGLIRSEIGREKQIGHAVLMSGGKPISSADELALAFRYEVLPLLQEYTYGDYSDLALLLGDEIIDTENQTPRESVLKDPELLVSALATHLNIASS